ncbi:MAG: hypothetical protein GX928_00675 [Ruminococcaceae bacterium]|nr:hypothetical protein [Oscillospiraceae bacterium]
MNCPDCGLELRIKRAYTEVVLNRPVMIQELACCNPNCERYKDDVVETIHHTLN